MKVLCTGGRDFKDDVYVDFAIATLQRHGRNREELFRRDFIASPVTHIIHGGAKGVDTMAGNAARVLGIQEVVCPANWNKFDKGAGPIRNTWMLDLLDPQHDLVMLFPGGKGTQDMVNKAVENGFRIYTYYDPRYDAQTTRMIQIANGQIEEEGQEVAAAYDGGGIPEGNAPVREVPRAMGNGIPDVGIGIGGGGGDGQAQEANQGGLPDPDNVLNLL